MKRWCLLVLVLVVFVFGCTKPYDFNFQILNSKPVYNIGEKITLSWSGLPQYAYNPSYGCKVMFYVNGVLDNATGWPGYAYCGNPSVGIYKRTETNTGTLNADHCYGRTGIVTNTIQMFIKDKKNKTLAQSKTNSYTINCGQTPQIPPQADSPFGVFNPYEVFLDKPAFVTREDINDYLKDLRVKWVQAMPREDVSELDTVAKTGANIYSRSLAILSPSCPEKMTDKYKDNLRALIRKYGHNIKYWEADTEPENNPLQNPGEGWGQCPEKYAEFLKITYEIIKKECSDCKVVFGGLGGAEVGLTSESHQVKFLNSVLKAGGGKYFDAFEFKQHYHKANEYTELKNKMEVYGKTFSNYGIDINKIPVFIETSMYDGTPETLNDPPLPYQSESQQAAGMLKTYAFGTAHGIDKIFWNYVVERSPEPTGKKEIFSWYGLVHNPQNDGLPHKKLSYYSFKKMIEMLEGSDWGDIRIIQEKDEVYIYKLSKQGKPVWVVWNDNPQEKQITIQGVTSPRVRITDAVPKYESGKEVVAYSTAFKTEIKTANDGVITLILGKTPVYVEEGA